MKLIITIDLDNSAFSFDDDSGPEDGVNGGEIARILRLIAGSYRHERLEPCIMKLYDINGNHVGESKITK